MKVHFLSSILEKFKTLTPEEKHLTRVNSVLTFGQGLSQLFINIYLWKQAHGIAPVVIFNLAQYPAVLAVFLIAGALPLKIQLRKLMGLGFLSYIASYLLLILLGANAGHYLIQIGVLYGLATGIYWSGNNAFTYLTTTDEKRDGFNAINSSIGSIISIASPIIAGIILSQIKLPLPLPNANYYLLFSIVISLFLYGFYSSIRLPKQYLPRTSLKNAIMPVRDRVWRLAGISAFIDGFKGGSIGFVASILTFQVLTHELNMAFYNSAFSFLTAIISIFLIGRINKKNRLKFGLIGATLFIFVHVLYIVFFSPNGIVLSSFIGVFANPLFNIGLASTFFLIIDSHPSHKKHYFTFITFREIPIAMGRIAGAGLFLLLLKTGSEVTIAKTWYMLLGFAPILFFFLTHKFNKIIEQQLAQNNTM